MNLIALRLKCLIFLFFFALPVGNACNEYDFFSPSESARLASIYRELAIQGLLLKQNDNTLPVCVHGGTCGSVAMTNLALAMIERLHPGLLANILTLPLGKSTLDPNLPPDDLSRLTPIENKVRILFLTILELNAKLLKQYNAVQPNYALIDPRNGFSLNLYTDDHVNNIFKEIETDFKFTYNSGRISALFMQYQKLVDALPLIDFGDKKLGILSVHFSTTNDVPMFHALTIVDSRTPDNHDREIYGLDVVQMLTISDPHKPNTLLTLPVFRGKIGNLPALFLGRYNGDGTISFNNLNGKSLVAGRISNLTLFTLQ